ncbi:uncharacterized protein BDR25DRAFT_396347 [Lindgomyces ingoldianus]|uniref:Uncharacterized protein n=1 Tax=Lindgomyces ingoldianus TaxID=673940 RepID=A0ACB6QE09_9PLEO|nr:uncharacterized protein BDR25DRAFT_396347 [Lindgomyces ingoldianus]KAF2465131.1 hypothetical protein BDR25DRAFT_396347 [Lindgomyces ingoldianus]
MMLHYLPILPPCTFFSLLVNSIFTEASSPVLMFAELVVTLSHMTVLHASGASPSFTAKPGNSFLPVDLGLRTEQLSNVPKLCLLYRSMEAFQMPQFAPITPHFKVGMKSSEDEKSTCEPTIPVCRINHNIRNTCLPYERYRPNYKFKAIRLWKTLLSLDKEELTKRFYIGPWQRKQTTIYPFLTGLRTTIDWRAEGPKNPYIVSISSIAAVGNWINIHSSQPVKCVVEGIFSSANEASGVLVSVLYVGQIDGKLGAGNALADLIGDATRAKTVTFLLTNRFNLSVEVVSLLGRFDRLINTAEREGENEEKLSESTFSNCLRSLGEGQERLRRPPGRAAYRASNGPYYGSYKVNRNGHVFSTNVPSSYDTYTYLSSSLSPQNRPIVQYYASLEALAAYAVVILNVGSCQTTSAYTSGGLQIKNLPFSFAFCTQTGPMKGAPYTYNLLLLKNDAATAVTYLLLNSSTTSNPMHWIPLASPADSNIKAAVAIFHKYMPKFRGPLEQISQDPISHNLLQVGYRCQAHIQASYRSQVGTLEKVNSRIRIGSDHILFLLDTPPVLVLSLLEISCLCLLHGTEILYLSCPQTQKYQHGTVPQRVLSTNVREYRLSKRDPTRALAVHVNGKRFWIGCNNSEDESRELGLVGGVALSRDVKQPLRLQITPEVVGESAARVEYSSSTSPRKREGYALKAEDTQVTKTCFLLPLGMRSEHDVFSANRVLLTTYISTRQILSGGASYIPYGVMGCGVIRGVDRSLSIAPTNLLETITVFIGGVGNLSLGTFFFPNLVSIYTGHSVARVSRDIIPMYCTIHSLGIAPISPYNTLIPPCLDLDPLSSRLPYVPSSAHARVMSPESRS